MSPAHVLTFGVTLGVTAFAIFAVLVNLLSAVLACRRELQHMATMYDVMELATALKPFLLRHLLDEGAPSATYLDPDIEVLAPLDDIAEAAERDGIVLTPHRLTPAPDDGLQPDEQVYAQCGTYNLGFVAVGPGARNDKGDLMPLDVKGRSLMPALIVPMPMVARPQAAACRGLTEQLHQFLTTPEGYGAGPDPDI